VLFCCFSSHDFESSYSKICRFPLSGRCFKSVSTDATRYQSSTNDISNLSAISISLSFELSQCPLFEKQGSHLTFVLHYFRPVRRKPSTALREPNRFFWRMSMSPLKREKTPIVSSCLLLLCRSTLNSLSQLEDDDPFAARRLLPKTWVARAAGPPVTPSSHKQKRFSPLSPPPFSGLVPLQPRNNTRRSSFISPPVEEEPVVSRKPSPAALPKHPQFYEFSSNATSSGISDDSKLFNTAPFPPPRLAEAEESPLTPKPMTTHEAGKLKKARFTELVDLSPTHAQMSTRPISSLLLSRRSTEPLYPGSTFSFSLSRSSLVNTPLPLSVKITFSGVTCTSNCASENEHLLFELSSAVELPETTWNGVITIPLSSICCTCDTANETLPPVLFPIKTLLNSFHLDLAISFDKISTFELSASAPLPLICP